MSEREFDITHTRIGKLLARLVRVESSPAFAVLCEYDRGILAFTRSIMLGATGEALAHDPRILERIERDPEMAPTLARLEWQMERIEAHIRAGSN